ncbi:hypothetical protein NPIL_395051 [Nephila pilipes]|uniref:Uncharacterized protein n=1 Tax=Nephila pilipes TaxID=299642 RepID=A0A8X6TDV6_NEPPI|nr:hypothetical protein NPIL_395051 [Nephila pilipes]
MCVEGGPLEKSTLRIRIRIQLLTTGGQSKERIIPSPMAILRRSKLGRRAYLVFFGIRNWGNPEIRDTEPELVLVDVNPDWKTGRK